MLRGEEEKRRREQLELSTYEGSTVIGDNQGMFAGLEAKRENNVCFDLMVVDGFESR